MPREGRRELPRAMTARPTADGAAGVADDAWLQQFKGTEEEPSYKNGPVRLPVGDDARWRHFAEYRQTRWSSWWRAGKSCFVAAAARVDEESVHQGRRAKQDVRPATRPAR